MCSKSCSMHQNIFMTLWLKCCFKVIAARWLEYPLFRAFNVATAEKLKVCMQYTKHNHLEVHKKKRFGGF